MAVSESRARATLRQMGLLHGSGAEQWLALSTSGTTTTPRTVIRSVESWEDSFDHLSSLAGIGAQDRVLVPAPPSGSMFAFARAHAAHVGAEVVDLERWSAVRAEQALTTCTVAHLTPPMLRALLDRPLGVLRTAVVAGAALPDSLRTRAREAGLRVVDYYGAAELSFVAIRTGELLAPFPEVEVEIRDGVIWARSPWLARGYAAGESGPLRWTEDGFATVGDLGSLDAAQGLVVTGRGDDTISSGGATVPARDVEAALTSIRGVLDAVVIGVPHPTLGEALEAVVVPADAEGSRGALEGIRSRATQLIHPTHLPRRWHLWPSLPLTEAGKVDRTEVRRRIVEAHS